jgi:hypothetical protein
MKVKLVRSGNSRGIRIPKVVLGASLILAKRSGTGKSWDTAPGRIAIFTTGRRELEAGLGVRMAPNSR